MNSGVASPNREGVPLLASGQPFRTSTRGKLDPVCRVRHAALVATLVVTSACAAEANTVTTGRALGPADLERLSRDGGPLVHPKLGIYVVHGAPDEPPLVDLLLPKDATRVDPRSPWDHWRQSYGAPAADCRREPWELTLASHPVERALDQRVESSYKEPGTPVITLYVNELGSDLDGTSEHTTWTYERWRRLRALVHGGFWATSVAERGLVLHWAQIDSDWYVVGLDGTRGACESTG